MQKHNLVSARPCSNPEAVAGGRATGECHVRICAFGFRGDFVNPSIDLIAAITVAATVCPTIFGATVTAVAELKFAEMLNCREQLRQSQLSVRLLQSLVPVYSAVSDQQ